MDCSMEEWDGRGFPTEIQPGEEGGLNCPGILRDVDGEIMPHHLRWPILMPLQREVNNGQDQEGLRKGSVCSR